MDTENETEWIVAIVPNDEYDTAFNIDVSVEEALEDVLHQMADWDDGNAVPKISLRARRPKCRKRQDGRKIGQSWVAFKEKIFRIVILC